MADPNPKKRQWNPHAQDQVSDLNDNNNQDSNNKHQKVCSLPMLKKKGLFNDKVLGFLNKGDIAELNEVEEISQLFHLKEQLQVEEGEKEDSKCNGNNKSSGERNVNTKDKKQEAGSNTGKDQHGVSGNAAEMPF